MPLAEDNEVDADFDEELDDFGVDELDDFEQEDNWEGSDD